MKIDLGQSVGVSESFFLEQLQKIEQRHQPTTTLPSTCGIFSPDCVYACYGK